MIHEKSHNIFFDNFSTNEQIAICVIFIIGISLVAFVLYHNQDSALVEIIDTTPFFDREFYYPIKWVVMYGSGYVQTLGITVYSKYNQYLEGKLTEDEILGILHLVKAKLGVTTSLVHPEVIEQMNEIIIKLLELPT